MFLDFFYLLRARGVPVTVKEYLMLLEGLNQNLANYSADDFYALSRAVLVKKETHLDAFDQVFGHYFEGAELVVEKIEQHVPEEWLRKQIELFLTPEEQAEIEALGGWEALLDRFKELMKEQSERHQGGNKWIGTGGRSPFGAFGFNPEGYRIGQNESRHRRAVKVWDQRSFKNLDDTRELDTRNMKMALRNLRVFTREGRDEEIDMEETIRQTAKNSGLLTVETRPPEKNNVKVLLLFDVGGSMDDHIYTCERLFSAARNEFKYCEFFYFHNCVYETLWRDNARRDERTATYDVLHKYNGDYRVVLVGDAAMSPYEIMMRGGSVEHFNEEAGAVWLERLKDRYKHIAWLNPVPEDYWPFYQSTQMLYEIMDGRMFPLTPEGVGRAAQSLI